MSDGTLIRLSLFLGILIVMSLWEIQAPRRKRLFPRRQRWPANLGIVALNTLLVRILIPATAIGLAGQAWSHQWGLFHILPRSLWITVPLTILLMDLAIYLQHLLFHAVPLLWRFHRMHHTDLDYDCTTGNRFHPVKILLPMLIKFSVIAALGAPPLGVLLFEIVLNVCATFNHANVFIPLRIDRILRLLVVTPDMHRVHHSVEPDETNSNFGFNLPWWDHLFGTYRAQPREGHLDMTIGLNTVRDPKQCLSFPRMLLFPLTTQAPSHTLHRPKS